jgi:hypothetical protein
VAVAASCLAQPSPDQAFPELVKLAQSGVDEEVVHAYIMDYPNQIHLSASQIVYLKDLGMSQKLISEALSRHRDAPPEQPVDSPEAEPQPRQPAPPSSISLFYEQLKPFGTWLQIDGGWYWQPHAGEANPDWRPYGNSGHWANTDWGWTWVSDYSWGWAPFHYGRWLHHHRFGWIWLPDTVWGPAWVVWRCNDDYFGWAPLPPRTRFVPGVGFYYRESPVGVEFDFGLPENDFCFVESRHFADHDLWEHREPGARMHGVFYKTRIIKQYDSDDQKRIINRGPSMEIVTRAVPHPVPRITITDLPAPPGLHARPGAPDRVEIYRPAIMPKPGVTPPRVAPAPLPFPLPTPGAGVSVSREREARAAEEAAKVHRDHAAQAAQEEQRFRREARAEQDPRRREPLRMSAEEQRKKADMDRKKAEQAEQFRKSLQKDKEMKANIDNNDAKKREEQKQEQQEQQEQQRQRDQHHQ